MKGTDLLHHRDDLRHVIWFRGADEHSRYDSAEVAEAASQQRFIEWDVLCSRCRYNLRGLTLSGRCPECGREVQASIDEYARRLAQAPPRLEGDARYARGAIRACMIFLIAVVIELLCALNLIPDFGANRRLLEFRVAIIAQVLTWYALCRLAIARPSRRGYTPLRIERGIVLVSAPVVLAAAIGSALAGREGTSLPVLLLVPAVLAYPLATMAGFRLLKRLADGMSLWQTAIQLAILMVVAPFMLFFELFVAHVDADDPLPLLLDVRAIGPAIRSALRSFSSWLEAIAVLIMPIMSIWISVLIAYLLIKAWPLARDSDRKTRPSFLREFFGFPGH